MTNRDDEKVLMHLRVPPELRDQIDDIRRTRPWLSSLSHAAIFLLERGLTSLTPDPRAEPQQ